jgi:putative transposase
VDSVVVEADMKRKRYPTDLTDAEWTILDPLIPSSKPGGRPRKVDMREIMNAIFYVLHGGIAFRMMPHDLPAWKTAYHYFRLWRMDGTWEELNGAMRERLRVKAGREATPSGAVMDSQSVRTTEKGGHRAMTVARR